MTVQALLLIDARVRLGQHVGGFHWRPKTGVTILHAIVGADERTACDLNNLPGRIERILYEPDHSPEWESASTLICKQCVLELDREGWL